MALCKVEGKIIQQLLEHPSTYLYPSDVKITPPYINILEVIIHTGKISICQNGTSFMVIPGRKA